MTEEFINPAKAASEAEVTTGRIYQILQSGALPHQRCLGRIRIRRTDWDLFVQAQEIKGQATGRAHASIGSIA